MTEAMCITTRRATLSDLQTLQKFEQEIIAAERPFNPTIRKGKVHYYDIAALIASTDSFVAIAEENGEPKGCGFVRKAKSRPFIEPPEHAYIGLMYVVPDFRGRGVSSLILETLSDWAKANGLFEMRLEVYPENGSAVRAYRKAGFTPSMLEMRLALIAK